MKISNATSFKKPVYAINTPEVKVSTQYDKQNKITSFTVQLKNGEIHVVPVKKFDILAAWKKVESICKTLN